MLLPGQLRLTATTARPPAVTPLYDGEIGDPKEEKWIVEGTLKADCLAERGICAISVSGVWNWRGTNQRGGKVALPDWNDVAIARSEFVIAYDSDVVHKKPVHAAMVELANYLYYRAGNRVRYCHLPEGPGGEKWGVDDYLAAGHTKQELWRFAATGEITHQLTIRRAEAARARKTADQDSVRATQEADKGRASINEFVTLMRKYEVQPETIYKESRGPHRWTYETIVGKGWLLERHQTAVHPELRYDLYIIPDLGFAKVVDRLPDREMIKALRYNTEPDNSDQAYRAWADRASDLSARAQSHIAKTSSTN